MKNWKNLSLLGREILDDASFATLREIMRTQNFGEPVEAFKGAVMHRQPVDKFKAAISDFSTNYHRTADSLISKSDQLSPTEGRRAVELLRRCELLMGMSQTYSEVNEAFRFANVMGGNTYTGERRALWKRLEHKLGRQELNAEHGRIVVDHTHHTLS